MKSHSVDLCVTIMYKFHRVTQRDHRITQRTHNTLSLPITLKE